MTRRPPPLMVGLLRGRHRGHAVQYLRAARPAPAARCWRCSRCSAAGPQPRAEWDAWRGRFHFAAGAAGLAAPGRAVAAARPPDAVSARARPRSSTPRPRPTPTCSTPTGFFAPDPFLFVQAGAAARAGDERPRDGPRAEAGARGPGALLVAGRARARGARAARPRRPRSSPRVLRDLRRARASRCRARFPLGPGHGARRAAASASSVAPDPFWPEREIKRAGRGARDRRPRCARRRRASRPGSRRCAPAASAATATCAATAGASRPRTCAPR